MLYKHVDCPMGLGEDWPVFANFDTPRNSPRRILYRCERCGLEIAQELTPEELEVGLTLPSASRLAGPGVP